MQQQQYDLVKMSQLSGQEQQYCYDTTPHKFSFETDQWAFDAKGLPICQYCGVIDDRHVQPEMRARKGRRRKLAR